MSKLALLFVLFANLSYANVCKNYDLFPTKFTEKQDELEANADKTSVSGKDIYKLSGNAEVYSNDYYVSADDIEIRKLEKTVNANNNVKIRAGDIYATGSSIKLSKKNNSINIKTDNIKYKYQTTGANGLAKELITTGEKQILNDSSYSFCGGDNKDWQLKANSITLDNAKNRGIAKNVKLEIFGIPVFWTPFYEWVLKGRASGFLFPSFTSYTQNDKTGYQVDIPYYFNIAPEKDFTLTLKHLNTRGQALNGLYRHLLANDKNDGYFETELEFLGSDKKTKTDRWLLDGEYKQTINKQTTLNLGFKRVSDKAYLQDIRHDNSEDTLKSIAKLKYEKDGLNTYIVSENEQLVENSEANYTRDLEIFAEKELEYKGVDLLVSGIYSSFKNKDNSKTTGDRVHLDIKASKEFSALEYSFTPHLRLNTTSYEIDNQDNKNRSSYSAGFDYKIFLEREGVFFDSNITQTLTPRISYLYTPKENQSALPNFDSVESNTTYNSLFTGDNWGGFDRIDDANNITIGFDSNIVDFSNGSTYANFGLARSYNIENDEKSNIIANADFNYGRWIFNNNWQYNDKLVSKNNTLSYKKDGINFFSISHHLNSNNEKSASLYGALPIFGKSHIFAGLNRSITEDINNYQTLGFVYDDCCTAFRLAHFKEYNTSDNNYDKVIKFEVIFKGLGTTDKKLREKISAQIPNYLPEL
jgi:LPS-assembly protein